MKNNTLFEFIKDQSAPENYKKKLVPSEDYILIEPKISNGTGSHIRVDKKFNNNVYYLTKVHYTQQLSDERTVRVYFTNNGGIRRIKANIGSSSVELSYEELHQVRKDSLLHYSKTIGYYYSEIKYREDNVKSKIAILSTPKFTDEINKLIEINPTNTKLYKMWLNINSNINKPPETKAIEIALDKPQLKAEEPIVSFLEDNIEHKESKIDPSLEIVSNLKKALENNLIKNEWSELVVNLDLLILYSQNMEHINHKVNEKFKEFKLNDIKKMYAIIEPNIDNSCFEELFKQLLLEEDKAKENQLLEIFEFLSKNSRKFVNFMSVLDSKMKKYNTLFMSARVNKFKQKMAIDIYKNLFNTYKSFEYITNTKFEVSKKFTKGQQELFDFLRVIIKNEDIASKPVSKELLDHVETDCELRYIFFELKFYHKIEIYLAFVALYGKYNLFEALSNCYDYFRSSFDKTRNSSNALGTCLAFLSLNPNRDLELSQYLQIFMDKGCNPAILSNAKDYWKRHEELLFDRARFARSRGYSYEIKIYGSSVLDFVYTRPFSLETVLPYENDLPKLMYHFNKLTLCPDIVMISVAVCKASTSYNYQDVVIDVNLKYRRNKKYVYSGRKMNNIIEFTSKNPKGDSKMLCMDLILAQIYKLIAASGLSDCYKYRDIMNENAKKDKENYMALSFYDIFLYYLGKIDHDVFMSCIKELNTKRLKASGIAERFKGIKDYAMSLKCESDIIEKVNYLQVIHTYYKPKFKSFLGQGLYCMVAYNDKELMVMSFSKYINKEQLLYNVNKIEKRNICIYFAGSLDNELQKYLETELKSIKFVTCEYNLAEVYFAFTNKELLAKFEPIEENYTNFKAEYDINDYKSNIHSFFKDHPVPFLYGASNESKLLSLVEKNDAEGVKDFFRSAYVYPVEAFIASYKKLYHHVLLKTFNIKEYSKREYDKSVIIFDTLLDYGGNLFYRFKDKIIEKRLAITIYNKIFKDRIESIEQMKLPNLDIVSKTFLSSKLLMFLGQVQKKYMQKKYTPANIYFNVVESYNIQSMLNLPLGLIMSPGLYEHEIEKISEVMKDYDFGKFYSVTEDTVQESNSTFGDILECIFSCYARDICSQAEVILEKSNYAFGDIENDSGADTEIKVSLR